MTRSRCTSGRLLVAVPALIALAGCATIDRPDPLEPLNRRVFAFNDGVDRAVLEPVASAYADDVPSPVRKGIGNFFANIDDVWSSINALLQGRAHDGFEDLLRVGANTVFGVLGVADVATDMGLQRHPTDLGQTLGHWGIGPGPYIVWPILGPSTLRDSTDLPLLVATPGLIAHATAGAVAVGTTHEIDTRAHLLGYTHLVDSAALDKYSFVRDGYLARRRSLICDCDPPPPSDDVDPQRHEAPGDRAAAQEQVPTASSPRSVGPYR